MTETEIKKVLTISTETSAKNIRELKDQIKILKTALNDVNATEEDNKQTLDLLRDAQSQLKNAMYESAKTTEQLITDTEKQGQSYNGLVKTLADLKSRWRETTDEAERAQLGEKINLVNNKLKTLDEGTGNFSRNVGNYTNSMVDAFTATAGSAGSMIAPIKGATTGLKAMSATPIIAIVGLLANIIAKLIEKFKQSEQSMKAVTDLMGIMSVGGDILAKIMDVLGKAIGKVADWLSKMLDKMGLVTDIMKERQALLKEEIAIQEDTRKFLKENADSELEIAKLKQKTADKINYTAKERLAFLKEASALEEENARRNEEIATREYNLLKRQNELIAEKRDLTTEEMDAEIQAYAKMRQAQTDYFNKTKELNAQITEATNAQRTEEKTAAAERKAQQDAELRERQERAKAQQDVQMQNIDRQIALAEKGSHDELNLTLQKMERMHQIEIEQAKATIEDKELLNTTLELMEQTHTKQMTDYQVNFIEEQMAIAEEAAAEQETFRQEQAKLKRENDLAMLEEGSNEYLTAEMEMKKYELDSLHQLEEESNEDFRARQIAADKAYTESKRALFDNQVRLMQQSAGAISGLMGSIADVMESGSENDKKAAQRAKNIRIASTTIDTISGAAGAYMQAVKSTPPPLGIILGAAQAATVAASGIAQINKIKATQINKDSSGSSASAPSSSVGASVQPPNIEQVVPTTTVVKGEKEEEQLNKMSSDQRVYILSSDLEANGKKVGIINAETSF